MFGKRSGPGAALAEPVAPPPAAVPGAEIATRPQKVEPQAPRVEPEALAAIVPKRQTAAAARAGRPQGHARPAAAAQRPERHQRRFGGDHPDRP